MSKYSKEDFMRGVIFKADTEAELLGGLSCIKGYELIDIQGTDRSYAPDQKFLLKSDEGQEIMVRHRDGGAVC